MDLFIKHRGHCSHHIVIHGYLTSLPLPEHVVRFFREGVSVPIIPRRPHVSGAGWRRPSLAVAAAISTLSCRVESLSNGPRSAHGGKTLFYVGSAEQRGRMPTACISYSKVQRRDDFSDHHTKVPHPGPQLARCHHSARLLHRLLLFIRDEVPAVSRRAARRTPSRWPQTGLRDPSSMMVPRPGWGPRPPSDGGNPLIDLLRFARSLRMGYGQCQNLPLPACTVAVL